MWGEGLSLEMWMIAEAPTLVEQNEDDPRIELGVTNEYVEALTAQREMKRLDTEKIRFATHDPIGGTPDELMDWFDNRM